MHAPEPTYEVGRWYLTQLTSKTDPLVARRYDEDGMFRASRNGRTSGELHWISPTPISDECLPGGFA